VSASRTLCRIPGYSRPPDQRPTRVYWGTRNVLAGGRECVDGLKPGGHNIVLLLQPGITPLSGDRASPRGHNRIVGPSDRVAIREKHSWEHSPRPYLPIVRRFPI